jgi:hypothetical protein
LLTKVRKDAKDNNDDPLRCALTIIDDDDVVVEDVKICANKELPGRVDQATIDVDDDGLWNVFDNTIVCMSIDIDSVASKIDDIRLYNDESVGITIRLIGQHEKIGDPPSQPPLVGIVEPSQDPIEKVLSAYYGDWREISLLSFLFSFFFQILEELKKKLELLKKAKEKGDLSANITCTALCGDDVVVVENPPKICDITPPPKWTGVVLPPKPWKFKV